MVRGHLRKRLKIRHVRINRRRVKMRAPQPRKQLPIIMTEWQKLPMDYNITMHRKQFFLKGLFYLYKYCRLLGGFIYQYWSNIYYYILFELTRYFFFKRLKSLGNTVGALQRPQMPRQRGVRRRKQRRITKLFRSLYFSRYFHDLIYRMLPLSYARLSLSEASYFRGVIAYRATQEKRMLKWMRHPKGLTLSNQPQSLKRLVSRHYNPKSYYKFFTPQEPITGSIRSFRGYGYIRPEVWRRFGGLWDYRYFFKKLHWYRMAYHKPIITMVRSSTKWLRFAGLRSPFRTLWTLQRQHGYRRLASFFLQLRRFRRKFFRVAKARARAGRLVPKTAIAAYFKDYTEPTFAYTRVKGGPSRRGYFSRNAEIIFARSIRSIAKRNFKMRYSPLTFGRAAGGNFLLKKTYTNVYTKYFRLMNWRYSSNRFLYLLDYSKINFTRSSMRLRRYNIFSMVYRNGFIYPYWKYRQVLVLNRFFINLGQRFGGVVRRDRHWYVRRYRISKGMLPRPQGSSGNRYYMRKIQNSFTHHQLRQRLHFLFRVVQRWATYMKKLGRLKLQLKFNLIDEPVTFSFLQVLPQTNLYAFCRSELFVKFYEEHVNYMYIKKTGWEWYYPNWFPQAIKEYAFYDLPLDNKINQFFIDLDLKYAEKFGDPLAKIARKSLEFRSYKHFGLKFFKDTYYPIEFDCFKQYHVERVIPTLWLVERNYLVSSFETYKILNLLFLMVSLPSY